MRDAPIVRQPRDRHKPPRASQLAIASFTREVTRAYFEGDLPILNLELANPLDVVRWNLDKGYLRDLEAAGVPIVPTQWGEDLAPAAIAEARRGFGAVTVIVKPTVGANADDTFRLPPETPTYEAEIAFAGRAYMLQPFVPAVVHEGEFSLFYFGGAYSHAILKTPASGDFRVQEEHGGRIRRVAPEPALRAASDAALAACPGPLLYARVDLVRWRGGFAVMEVELIEPSLYFPYDADSPERFALAVDAWLRAG